MEVVGRFLCSLNLKKLGFRNMDRIYLCHFSKIRNIGIIQNRFFCFKTIHYQFYLFLRHFCTTKKIKLEVIKFFEKKFQTNPRIKYFSIEFLFGKLSRKKIIKSATQSSLFNFFVILESLHPKKVKKPILVKLNRFILVKREKNFYKKKNETSILNYIPKKKGEISRIFVSGVVFYITNEDCFFKIIFSRKTVSKNNFIPFIEQKKNEFSDSPKKEIIKPDIIQKITESISKKSNLLYSFIACHFHSKVGKKIPKSKNCVADIKPNTHNNYKSNILENECKFFFFRLKTWSLKFFSETLSKKCFGNKPNFLQLSTNISPMIDFKAKFYFINEQKYQKIKIIGRGGSSKVFKVINGYGEIYALKRIKIKKSPNQNIHNFISEVGILKLLIGYQRIIQIKDVEFNIENGTILILLEYGDMDLNHLLYELQKKHENNLKIRLIWKQMLEAVKILHQEKIIHGDLKPGNFIISGNYLKLIDFGISKTIKNNTNNITRNSEIGTLNYMSPESIIYCKGNNGVNMKIKLGTPTDIWSLGCILFQLIFGFSPFYHLTAVDKIDAITRKSFEISIPDYSYPFATEIIHCCLNRSCELRPTLNELIHHPFIDNLNFET